jgi:hypothetical protein
MHSRQLLETGDGHQQIGMGRLTDQLAYKTKLDSIKAGISKKGDRSYKDGDAQVSFGCGVERAWLRCVIAQLQPNIALHTAKYCLAICYTSELGRGGHPHTHLPDALASPSLSTSFMPYHATLEYADRCMAPPLFCAFQCPLKDGTCEDTFSEVQYHELLHNMMRCGTAASDRNQAVFTSQFSSVGRSDDARRFYTCDLVKPRVIEAIGKLLGALLSGRVSEFEPVTGNQIGKSAFQVSR